jgi:hypothetical protein
VPLKVVFRGLLRKRSELQASHSMKLNKMTINDE